MDSSTAWSNMDPTLSVASHDDFQQFLDMGINNLGDSLQFDFPDFNSQQGQDGQLMQQDGGERMESRMDGNHRTMGHDTTMQEHMPAMTATQNLSTIPGPTSNGQRSGSIVEIDAQIQYLQQQRQQRQMQEQHKYYTRNGMIPPTPNSMELHGNNGAFFSPDAQQQGMYDRYRMQVKDHDMAFTPLVSPAVTPLDAHFNIPEYTVPGAYFSPLSSPALLAQNEHTSVYDQLHSNTTNSPVDMNIDSHSAPPSSTILAKSGRKPPQKTRGARKIQQSPITKPRKGKKGSSTNIPTQALGDILEPENPQVTRSKAASSESENGSISPEHLSYMAPPPVPAPTSAGKSPYARPQKDSRTQRLSLGSPATPASLMRLTQSPANQQIASHDMDIDDQGIEAFALPEAANDTRPPMSRIESDGQITPTLASSGSKTPGFHPLPSPAFTLPRGTVSATQSPQIDPMNETSGPRRTPNIAPRAPKKRFSSSVLASPALLPRISPSIKPLLPGGGSVSDDTASLLLASKSNYQNILEGTHLPGVSYPMELSTNLTSKRTSHKIAEQGRRNRINSALQEIATLLPRSINSKDSGGEKSGSGEGDGEIAESAAAKGASQSANSKASTVEHAIEYIKQLKQDLEDANRRAEEAEKRLSTKVEAKIEA